MRAIALAGAVLALAAPAAAQDGSEASTQRTPENAQRFLSQLPQNFEVTIISYGSHRSMMTTIVKEVRNEGLCRSELRGLPKNYVLHDQSPPSTAYVATGDANLFRPVAGRIAALGMKDAPYLLDWGRIPEITRDPPSPISGQPSGEAAIRLRLPDTSVIHLFFPSAELAGRAMLAMEMLRVACDPIPDTGF